MADLLVYAASVSRNSTADGLEAAIAAAGRSVFDLSLSGRPGASKAEGGGEKTKTRKQRGPGGPALQTGLRTAGSTICANAKPVNDVKGSLVS